MAVNPASAAAYIVELLNLLSKKKKSNESLLNSIKKKSKVIGGVPFIPTGLEDKTPEELLKELNSAYGALAPISFSSSNTLAGSNLTSSSEDEDSLQISQSQSSAEDVPITACPIDIPTVLPNYTKDEIQKVVEEAAKECDTRGVISPLIKGLGVNEVLDAKCDIVAPIPVGNAVFLDIAPSAPTDEKEPANSLKKPTKTLVVLNTTKGLGDKVQKPKTIKSLGQDIQVIKKGLPVSALKKEGDSVNCGDPILTIGNRTITSPSNGILRNLYVKDIAAKNDKLFLIEETSPQDTIDNVKKESEVLSKKINKLSSLKEQLGKIEPRLWTLKQIWGVYEGQYQGYIAYYNKFTPLIKKIEDLQAEFNEKLAKLKSVVATKQDNLLVWNSLNAEYTKVYERLKEIPGEISTLNTQLDVIKKEQPLYFSTKSDTGVLAAVKKGTESVTISGQTYAADKQYVFVPNKIADKADATPLKDINEGLANIIRPFTNNILFNDKVLSLWKDKDLDINSANPLTFSELRLVDPTNYALMFNDSGGNSQFWEGSMWKVRKDFLTKARGFGEEVKNITDTDLIEQKSNVIREQEKNIPVDIEDEANKSYDRVVEYSKNYGYYQANVGSIFTKSATYPDGALKKKRDDAKGKFDELYKKYFDIRKEITDIEKDIESFPQKLDEILGNSCKITDASESTAANINGEDVNLINWPATKSEPPKDDDNYKGNPQPNSPPITELAYWKKYCKKATTVNLLPIYWPIGLLIPTPGPLIKIPLPVIWKPIAVIPTPICLIVIGIDICGICPAPWIYIVNPGWPFPIGMVASKASWFLTGIRGPSKIDDETTSVPLAAIPNLTVPLKYKQNGQDKEQPVTIDAAPFVTKLLPLVQDDLPPYERLTLTNLPYIVYLTKWCAAGKKTMGFFENP